ncbi:uncharacterized protein MELLADRAFT_107049 [Melampsora larici-populina 98AG31]|uniref:Uncharacterized protein n=1 Tax=Melampsora larici-populina (strain 98AG31 / pathotype 3-4-7) TaxID=747676 RepID=F4RNH6_MELLP|nr:uncharacterized protein MELLADRAFT_107049 [Melampsora larici-populina 98AG31]EGG05990.1 hypothetical protein MELLADRAFT_107049 [Melampsora larici-populina 98AG31]
MTKKGRSIQCPGGPNGKRRRIKLIPGSAQLLAEIEAADASSSKDRADKLAQALSNIQFGPTQGNLRVPLPVDAAGDTSNRQGNKIFHCNDENDGDLDDNYIDNFVPHPGIPEDLPPVNPSVVLQEKTIEGVIKLVKGLTGDVHCLHGLFPAYLAVG